MLQLYHGRKAGGNRRFAAWSNFVRIHQTLRVTPAMESGITRHVWTITEMLSNISA